MRPGEPMAEALRAELAPHAKKLKKRLRRARRGDPASIHDARTTIRRLREGLAIMGRTVYEPQRTRRFASALRDIEHDLGPTRDDDVLLGDIADWLRRHPAKAAALRGWIRQERALHMRRLARRLRRRRTRRAVRRLRRWLDGRPRDLLPLPKNPARAAPTLVRHFAPEEAWHAYDAIVAFEPFRPSGYEMIHKVRAACRRLRYLLELFHDALPAGAVEVIEVLHRLQDRLGELHDHAVAIARVERAVASARLADGPTVQAYLSSRRAARDRLRSSFTAEWNALVGDPFRLVLAQIAAGPLGRSPQYNGTAARA